MKAMNKALSVDDSGDSAMRKFSLTSLWAAAGRASEVAWTTWDGLEWDPEFQAVYATIPQSKPSKAKTIPFLAGENMHTCWFLAFGDYLAISSPGTYSTNEPCWLIPDLHGTATPGDKLGSFVKGLYPAQQGGAKKFEKVAVWSLPKQGATAGGIRPGVCNTLARYMPGELIVQITGHELKNSSAVYEYIDAQRALAIPG